MKDDVIGLVPAAGKGVRLGLPYPKELYPVIRDNRYRPIAEFVVDNLLVAGIRHIVFVINETKHQLLGYFGSGDRLKCNISYVVQDKVNRGNSSSSPGLAHALDSAYHLIREKTVFFGMPDTIMRPRDVFVRGVEESKPDDDVVLMLFQTTRPEKFGMVSLGSDRQVLQILDKPRKTELIEMWGSMFWRPRFTEYLHDSVKAGLNDFAEIMNRAIVDGFKFRGVSITQGTYADLGTYDEVKNLDRSLREGADNVFD